MKNKKFEIINNDISDGYHTFNELYEHRCLLFILAVKGLSEKAYVRLDHYQGWDCVYQILNGKQISYHLPAKYRDYYMSECEVVGEEFVWDGHSSLDTIDRIKSYLDRC